MKNLEEKAADHLNTFYHSLHSSWPHLHWVKNPLRSTSDFVTFTGYCSTVNIYNCYTPKFQDFYCTWCHWNRPTANWLQHHKYLFHQSTVLHIFSTPSLAVRPFISSQIRNLSHTISISLSFCILLTASFFINRKKAVLCRPISPVHLVALFLSFYVLKDSPSVSNDLFTRFHFQGCGVHGSADNFIWMSNFLTKSQFSCSFTSFHISTLVS